MTRYLRVGKNPRRVIPPTSVLVPTAAQPARHLDATGGNEPTATTNHDINLPTAVAGDLLMLIFYTDGTPSATPTGWTADGSNPYSGMYVYSKVSVGTETAFVLTTTGAAESAHISWSIRGATTYEISGTPTGGGNTNPDPPSISPSAAPGTYLVYAVAGASGINDASNWPGNATPPSGYTLIDQGRGESSGGDEKLWIGYAVVDITTAEDPGTMSPQASTGYSWRSITIAVPYGAATIATASHTHNVNDADDVGTGATTKGDLLVHDGTDYERLAVGSNNQVLTADSAQSLGVKWATGGAGASALNDLTDVTITAAATGEVLQYNGSAWVDAGLPLTDLSNVTISSAVTGEVLKYNGSIWVNDTDDTGAGLPSASAKGDIAVYNGSSWVIRAVGSNDQVLTADSAQSDGVKWAAGGSGATVPQWIEYLAARQSGETSHSDDDFFDDASAAGWTAVTPSGTSTVTEQYDVLSALFHSQTASDLCGVMIAMSTTSAPITIETRIRAVAKSENFLIYGMAFADGTSDSSNIAAGTINGETVDYVRSGTFTAAGAPAGGTVALRPHPYLGGLYLRLIWKTANTFAMSWSPDGVSWTDAALSDASVTLTPTYYGLVWSRWGGGAEPSVATYDYFRVYESDLSV